MQREEIPTPALVVSAPDLDWNLSSMSQTLPGERLRPHVKAHKCTSLARLQRDAGHRDFTCATSREIVGMAEAGLGDDLLLANESVDAKRLALLGGLVSEGRARITIAVDSEETIEAAAKAKLTEVLIDVNVGLPRCGCEPEAAGRLASLARDRGLEVRGVMGYEGHAVGIESRREREEATATAMALLAMAHAEVGGAVVSAGGTGTYDINTTATEIQAGSYALMDTAYAKLGLPFRNALSVLSTVISVSSQGWAVCDAGLKSLGMDHGNPSIEGMDVWFCSDEHVTFSMDQDSGLSLPKVGELVTLLPAHVDPTIAYHDIIYIVDGAGPESSVVDTWPIDLRGW